jgi:hypothetical protein
VQAARGVSFMLQSEKSAFSDFAWYVAWTETAKAEPVLKWLNETRVDLVRRHALAPHSWIEMRCLGNPRDLGEEDDDPVRRRVSPFIPTYSYVVNGPHTDHAHEFTRHWSMDGLAGRELLEVTADVYDRLDELVRMAHQRLGASMVSHQKEGAPWTQRCAREEDAIGWRPSEAATICASRARYDACVEEKHQSLNARVAELGRMADAQRRKVEQLIARSAAVTTHELISSAVPEAASTEPIAGEPLRRLGYWT